MKKLLIIFLLLIFSACRAELETQNSQNTSLLAENTAEKSETKTMENTLNPDNFENLASVTQKAVIKTNKGDITIEFYVTESPFTVNNFLNLSKLGFYNGTIFHRVIPDFMIQAGDPNSKNEDRALHGSGGPGYRFDDEINTHKLVRGSVAMANSGPDTNGSQFFIVTKESTPWLDGLHTNFGYVVDGMDIVDAIEALQRDERDNPIEPVVIESVELIKK